MAESPADLQQRLDRATAEIAELRAEAALRQAELRALAARLPERVSRRAVISEMITGTMTGMITRMRGMARRARLRRRR